MRAPDGALYPEMRVTTVNDQVQEGNVGDVVKELTDETFQQAIDEAANPVIVDFWAPGAARAGRSVRSSKTSPARTPTR